MPKSSGISRLQRYKRWINVKRKDFVFPHSEQSKVEESLYRCTNVEGWNIPKLTDESFENELFVFKTKLLFWQDVLEKRTSFMPPIEVLKRSLFIGPEFAAYVKDAREESLRYISTGKPLEHEYEFAFEGAWGHDFFFSPRDMINWVIPDDYADIKRLFIEPPDVSPSLLREFIAKAREYIKIPLRKPELDDLDILASFTGTSTFLAEDPKRSSSNYEARIGKTHRISKDLTYKYAMVQKNPAEARAAVVASTDSMNKIKLFHKMFKAVTDCPEDYYFSHQPLDGLESWLSKGYIPSIGYIMTDIKKSGLTFNRHIHNALIDLLDELMPTWGWHEFRDYANAKIYVPWCNTPLPITNGYGLGVMDCVISFTQAIIFNLYKDTCSGLEGFRAEGKFWSDDSIIRVKSLSGAYVTEESMETFLTEWNGYLAKFGIVVHDKKPYFSKLGVFLEVYGTEQYSVKWDSSKTCQFVGRLFDTLRCPSIYRAKEMFAALMLDIPASFGPWVDKAFSQIVSFWGYEFSPHEVRMPYEAGGWCYNVTKGINTFLHDAQEYEDHIPSKLVQLCTVHRPPKRTLMLHKKHKDYIQNIRDFVYFEDPTHMSWDMKVRATLNYDYKSRKDWVSLEKHSLKLRQLAWEKILKNNENPYKSLMEFWDAAKGEAWYLPPVSRLVPYTKVTYNVPKGKKPPWTVDLTRMYYACLNHLGLSSIKVVDPNHDLRNKLDVMACILGHISGYAHKELHEVAFILQNGYDLDHVYSMLEERYGRCYKLSKDTEASPEVTKIIQDCMGPFSGDQVWTLDGTHWGFLSPVHPRDPESYYYPDHPSRYAYTIGAAGDKADKNFLYSFLRDDDVWTNIISRHAPPVRRAPTGEQVVLVNGIPMTEADINNLIGYYGTMMHEAATISTANFTNHDHIGQSVMGHESLYASAFDDMDDEDGLFGFMEND